MTQVSDLKPCPFCGTSFETLEIADPGLWIEHPEHDWCPLSMMGAESDVETMNRRASGWVSVEERLPSHHDTVVIITEGRYGEAYSALYDDEDKRFNDSEGHDIYVSCVTHWQPLPSPLEEGQ